MAQLTSTPGLDQMPSFSPDGSSMAYSSDRGGAFEIYVRRWRHGRGETQLTRDGEQNLDRSGRQTGGICRFTR